MFPSPILLGSEAAKSGQKQGNEGHGKITEEKKTENEILK